MAVAPPGSVGALIVAGGRGVRAGGHKPKQYQTIAGRSVLAWSLRPFLRHPSVDSVTIVIDPDHRGFYAAAVEPHSKITAPVEGGRERQDSARLGLEAMAARPPRLVLIHDGARPLVTARTINSVLFGLGADQAVVPGVLLPDTLKRGDSANRVEATISRDGMFAIQTPQGFDFAAILDAHRKAASLGDLFTDDAAVAEQAGLTVRIVDGEGRNKKITTEDDMAMARGLLSFGAETRVGNGYDVHSFGPGDEVTIGGVKIPHYQALVGHSDADVALHALTDAILGAIADGDIGTHFPPTDLSLAGASSDRFLAEAVRRLSSRRAEIVHLDVTIIAEEPEIGPHRDAMRDSIAAICGVDKERVSIKATTNEHLGFIGRGEGIAALATATIRLNGAGA